MRVAITHHCVVFAYAFTIIAMNDITVSINGIMVSTHGIAVTVNGVAVTLYVIIISFKGTGVGEQVMVGTVKPTTRG